MSRSYVVLQSDPDEETVYAEMYAFFELLQDQLSLQFDFLGTQEVAADLVVHLYEEANGKALLTLANDWRIRARYLMVEAPAQELAQQIAALAARQFPAWTLDELRKAAAAQQENEPEALIRMAYGAPEQPDAQTLRILQKAAGAASDEVRYFAAEAAAICGWPELAAVFLPLTISDPSPEVREMAAHALSAAERTGPFAPKSQS